MLSMIKGIINQKKDFLEAAEIILEDGMGNSLDDAIILGEDSDPIPQDNDSVVEEENMDEPKEDPKEDNPEEPNEDPKEDDTGDIMDQPVDDVSSSDEVSGDITDEPVVDDSVSDEPTSTPEEAPLPIPGDDTLPEPVSNVTGEPVADDNLLTMELDLSTNTPKDVLPVPPANAGDAVVSDDLINQRIDSGFGGDDGIDSSVVPEESSIENDPIDNPVESNEPVVDDLLSEAITIADPVSEESPAESSAAPAEGDSTEVPPAEGDITSEPAPAEEPPADNDVTAAVKDKVAEADAPAYDGDSETTKEELMKKLSNITKNLEDAKRAVMSAI